MRQSDATVLPAFIMSLTTGNNAIDALVYSSWNGAPNTAATLTYGFLTRAPLAASADDRSGFQAMSTAQQAAVRDALAQWASVANLTFVEVAVNSGDLQFGTNAQSGSSAYAYLPDGGAYSVQMYLNNKSSYNTDFTAGTYAPSVLIHEIGHMLGLKHPGDYDSRGSGGDGPFLPAATDNGDYTLMSYNDPSSYAINRTFNTTPMLYDIQAMQYLYGANMSYHAGDNVYKLASNTPPMCIWDAGGSDTLDFSACTGASVVNLNAGAFSETARGLNNVSIAYNVTIESAIGGAGGTTFYANGAGNRLTGGAGSDLFYQGAGNDTIAGAGGHDTVVFQRDFASYTLVREGDTLTVRGEGADILTGIESLRFADRTVETGAITSMARQYGTAASDIIHAPATAAWIDAGTGVDTVLYGQARSAYQVHAGADGHTVLETATGITDVLSNAERIEFADGKGVALDASGAAGQLYRLYETAFNREPDALGMGFWLKAIDAGAGIAAIAAGFTQSPEYQALYGHADNQQFITQLYLNSLDRAYEEAGLRHWMGALDNGMSRAQVLIGFSESAELQALLIGHIQDGVEYVPFA
jgi:serralysin